MFWNILLGLSLTINSAWAADNALESYLQQLKSLQGQFQQAVYDEQGTRIEESQGNFALQKPSQFHWQYSQPYEQLIVANGEYIWIYDADLEQVTRRVYETAITNTPVLLFSNADKLDEHFHIGALEATTDSPVQGFELIAKSPDSSFEKMLVYLDKQQLQQIELHDKLGQRTQITFSAQTQNQVLHPHLFDFVIPKGVDVIEDH